MAKGRMKQDDLDVLHGIADGIVKKGNHTREKKGTRTKHTFESPDETMILIFDTKINKNSPISIEYIPKKGSVSKMEPEQDYELLPKTQRKYINPANGKEVGYARAKTLGII